MTGYQWRGGQERPVATDFPAIMERLVREQVAPKVMDVAHAWDVCEALMPSLPPRLKDRMASEYLANQYHRSLKAGPEPALLTPKRATRPRKAVIHDPTAEMAEIESRMWASISDAVAKFEESVRLDVTAELLATEFVGAEAVVTWSTATKNDHRVASLTAQQGAADAVTAAARHERAIEMLDQAGASCLGELDAEAAA